jgi:hypothetical protein
MKRRRIFDHARTSAFIEATGLRSCVWRGYVQASSEEDQIVKEVNKPQLVTMNSTDAAKGLKNNKGVVTVDQTGTYFMIVGVQVGSRGKAPCDRVERRRRLVDRLARPAAELSRTCSVTNHCRGTTSSVSVTSSPIFDSFVSNLLPRSKTG